MKLFSKGQNLEELKQYWMRVSFLDGVKLGAGFVVGIAIAAVAVKAIFFIVGMLIATIFMMFGSATEPTTYNHMNNVINLLLSL